MGMYLRLLLLFSISATAMLGCADTKFTSSDGKKKTKRLPPLPPPHSGDVIPGGLTVDQGTGNPQECWFAVSGAYFGFHGKAAKAMVYESTFPLPNDSSTIGHGKQFDTVGGVFLNARPEPFQYQTGGGEIDLAIDATFDSVAVAPGMTVEIRDGNGVSLYNGQGPYMAIASDRAEDTTHVSDLLRQRAGQMPTWMVRHLESIGYLLPTIPMHASRWVKVAKIAGRECK